MLGADRMAGAGRTGSGEDAAQTGAVGAAPAGDGQRGGGQRGGGGRSTSASPAPGMPRDWIWWKDDAVTAELGLSAEKAAQIDRIYQSRVQRIRPFADEFVREQDILNRMTRERTAAPEAYEIQASKYEFLRSEVQKSRWVMLYRIYTELEPDQYQKLLEIRDRRFARGRGGQPR